MSSSIIQFQLKIISRWSSKSKVRKKDRPVRLIGLVLNSKTHSTTFSVSEHTLEILLKVASFPRLMPNASSSQYIHFLRILGGMRSSSSCSCGWFVAEWQADLHSTVMRVSKSTLLNLSLSAVLGYDLENEFS